MGDYSDMLNMKVDDAVVYIGDAYEGVQCGDEGVIVQTCTAVEGDATFICVVDFENGISIGVDILDLRLL